MGFWIFMLLMGLFMPAIMIVFGKSFVKNAPKEINSVYGYRTTMSMKNRDTWEFAHNYCGKLWLWGGLIILPVSMITMFFVLGKGTDVVGTVGAILEGVQVAFLVGSIFPTEIALNKTFNKDGSRKKTED